jgi:hypothetical protein
MVLSDFEKHRIDTEFALSQVAQYYNALEDQIHRLKDEKLEQVRKLVEEGRLPNGFEQSFIEGFEITIARNFRYSYIVLLCLVAENRLEAICDYVQKQKALPLRARDLAGDSFAKCTKYLKQMAQVPLTQITYWAEADDLLKIRNCIVHTEGRIQKSRDSGRLRDLCKQKKGITRSGEEPNEVLVIGPQYCIAVTDHMIETFSRINIEIGYADNPQKDLQ